MPSPVDAPFRPAWWAPTGLLQTLAGMRAAGPAPAFRTETLATPDDDALQLHHADAGDCAGTIAGADAIAGAGAVASAAGPDSTADTNAIAGTDSTAGTDAIAGAVAGGGAASRNAPRVLLLHGLEGSRHSPYVRATARHAAAAGFVLTVLEFRSCGGTLNRARRTYHSGETTDLALVVATLVARAPRAPLLLLGFSLGANVLLKWLGETGDRVPAQLRAAAAISPPFDLATCAAKCDTTYRGAIARHFLRSLVPKAIAKERQFPRSYDADAVRRCRTFVAFDDLVTAPVHGFRSAAHYYETQSCGPFLPRIAVPTLLIAAADDPLSSPAVLPHAAVAASRVLSAEFPPHGGHVGFVDGGWPCAPRRWAEARAVRFFREQFAR